jgi:ribonuclease BN (tRNA processing enzyme)
MLDDDDDDVQYELSFQGGGIAGVSSALLVTVTHKRTKANYSVLFDAGGLALPRDTIKRYNNLPALITHLHPDHCSGVHTLLSARSLVGLHTNLFIPAHSRVQQFEQMIALQAKIGESDESKKYDYKYTVLAARPFEGFKLAPNREIIPF